MVGKISNFLLIPHDDLRIHEFNSNEHSEGIWLVVINKDGTENVINFGSRGTATIARTGFSPRWDQTKNPAFAGF